MNNNLVASLFNVMDSLLHPHLRPEGTAELSVEEREHLREMLPSLMLFSVVWSLGASCDKNGRPQFDQFIRDQVWQRGGNGDQVCVSGGMATRCGRGGGGAVRPVPARPGVSVWGGREEGKGQQS